MMKREISSSPTPNQSSSDRETSSASSTPTKKQKITKASPNAKSPKKTALSEGSRGALLDEIIAIGVRAADLGALAEKYGMTKSQMIDQFKPNRANIRSKAVKAVGGE